MAMRVDEALFRAVLKRIREGRRPFATVDAAIRWAIENPPMACRAIDPSAVYTGQGGHGMQQATERFTMVLAAMARLDKARWVALKMRACGSSYREIERELGIRNGRAAALVESARKEVHQRLIEYELMEAEAPQSRAS